MSQKIIEIVGIDPKTGGIISQPFYRIGGLCSLQDTSHVVKAIKETLESAGLKSPDWFLTREVEQLPQMDERLIIPIKRDVLNYNV